MILQMHYTNTAPSPWIETKIREGFENVSQRLGGRLVESIQVFFEVVNGQAHPGQNLYRVKVLGFSPERGRFVIQKTASAPDAVLTSVLHAAKAVLDKKKFSRHRALREMRRLAIVSGT